MPECSHRDCRRESWPGDSAFCILHSQIAEKPGFWDVIAQEQSIEAQRAVGSRDKFDLRRPQDLPPPWLDQITIHLDRLWIPHQEIPSWIWKYDLEVFDTDFTGRLHLTNVSLDRKAFSSARDFIPTSSSYRAHYHLSGVSTDVDSQGHSILPNAGLPN